MSPSGPVSRPAVEDLFDAEFLESVQRLRIVARRVPRGGRFAEQRSKAQGHGIEFRDYRAYTPGDELRAIDWNVYRRLGRVFLRLFEELEDLPVYLAPDVSRSAYLETPPRARAGLRAALAFAAISLGQHDRVGVLPWSDDLSVLVRPRSGKGRLLELAARLAEIEPGGRTDLARSLATLESQRLRRGLVVLISDFFDPGGLEAIEEAAKRVRHELLFVQLARVTDREPAESGDLRLVDCETGESQDVSVTSEVRSRYRAAYERFQADLSELARRRGVGLLTLDTDRDIAPQLADVFEVGGELVV